MNACLVLISVPKTVTIMWDLILAAVMQAIGCMPMDGAVMVGYD